MPGPLERRVYKAEGLLQLPVRSCPPVFILLLIDLDRHLYIDNALHDRLLVSMRNPSVDDIFDVPEDFQPFEDDAEANLPDYQPYDISQRSGLTLTDCHSAIRATIRQVRLIAFEIARKNKPFFKRSLYGKSLEGEPRQFDIVLSSIDYDFKDALAISSIDILEQSRGLLDVLRRPLLAHKDFKDSSGDSSPDFQEGDQDLDI